MNRPWMDLIERSGDQTLGAALLRLARQSVAVHLAETAERAKSEPTRPAPRRTSEREVCR